MSNHCSTKFDSNCKPDENLLSLAPGFGQLKNGQLRKGILFLQISVINFVLLLGILLKAPLIAAAQNFARHFDLALNQSFIGTVQHMRLTSPLILVFILLALAFLVYAVIDAGKYRLAQARQKRQYEFSEALGNSYLVHVAILLALGLGVAVGFVPKPAARTITLEFALQEAPEEKEQMSNTIALKSAADHGRHDPNRQVSKRVAGAPSAAAPQSAAQADRNPARAAASEDLLKRAEKNRAEQQEVGQRPPVQVVEKAQEVVKTDKRALASKAEAHKNQPVKRRDLKERQVAQRRQHVRRPQQQVRRSQLVQYHQSRRAYSSAPAAASPDEMGRRFNQARNYDNKVASYRAMARPDFGSYMRDVERRMKRRWDPPRTFTPSRVTVLFQIHSNGAISNLRIARSSGMAGHDRAAIQAVGRAAPFKPLPPGAPPFIRIEFAFDSYVRSASRL